MEREIFQVPLPTPTFHPGALQAHTHCQVAAQTHTNSNMYQFIKTNIHSHSSQISSLSYWLSTNVSHSKRNTMASSVLLHRIITHIFDTHNLGHDWVLDCVAGLLATEYAPEFYHHTFTPHHILKCAALCRFG